MVGGAANTIAEFAVGAEGEVLVVSSGQLSWASTSPAAAHSMLSVTHSDVTATSTLIRGDLLVADSDDKWNRLAIGTTGYMLYSDGLDTKWSTTTVINALGTITQGVWQANTIEISFGGTGATTATGARENLDLDESYKLGINATGTAGDFWVSDGNGRGQWVATSTLGLGGTGNQVSKFVGTTTLVTDGAFATSSLTGYKAANQLCADEYPNSHFCRTYDIMVSIEQDDTATWSGMGWVAEGPPGFTSNSNDCQGWTSNDAEHLGAWWNFASSGGAGWLIYCDYTRPLACCSWQ